jgi:hypothetical protein
MSNLVFRLGRGAVKNARLHLQAPSRSVHALANSSGGGVNSHSSTTKIDVSDVPSLRNKLENDMQALEWGSFSSSSSATTAHSNESTRSSLRSGTAALAARISNSVYCPLDPETPRYLATAMEDATSSQCRLIVTSDPPFRVVQASPAWESLTGIAHGQTEGRPALSVILSGQSTQLEGVDSLIESLHLNCRGCATVACRSSSGGGFPAKVTVSPLIDGNGDISHMLCVVKPL